MEYPKPVKIRDNVLVEKIVNQAPRSKLFTVIADETTDTSTKEQLAICVLYLDIDDGIVREQLIGMANPHETTGEALATAILAKLGEVGLN